MTFQFATYGLQFDSIGGGLFRIAFYNTTDPISTLLTDGYFVEARQRGARVGDLIMVYDTLTAAHYTLAVTEIDADGTATVEVTSGDEILTPEDFGVQSGILAGGYDEYLENTLRLQQAIDASGMSRRPLNMAGRYYVVPQPDSPAIELVVSAGNTCLYGRSYATLIGKGVITVPSTVIFTGAGAILGSDGDPITRMTVREIEVDGGVPGALQQFSGIALVDATESLITETSVHDVGGFGVAFLATVADNEVPSSLRDHITYNTIKNTQNIPIEMAHGLAGKVIGNTVDNTASAMLYGGNGIDIYGIPADPSDVVSAETIITDNHILGGWNGIFIESAFIGLIANNEIDFIEPTAEFKGRGIWINSATAFSYDMSITGNKIRGGNVGLCGIDCRLGTKVSITNNTIIGFKHGMLFRDGANNGYIGPNTFDEISDYIIYAEKGSIEFNDWFIDRQIYLSTAVSGFPKAFVDPSEPATSGRYFNARFSDAWCVTDNKPLSRVYWGVAGKLVLADGSGGSPSWGAYATFTGGETLVYSLLSATVGEYVRINGVYYLVHAVTGGQVTIRSSSGVAADYTAVTNGAYAYYRYTADNYARLIAD